MTQPFNHMPHMDPTHQMPLLSHEEETYMLLPSQASARLPVVPTQFPNVYATQPAVSVFDGPVVVMPVSHYLGLLGMSGTSPVGPATALPAAVPHQYSTTSAQHSATFAADPRAAHSPPDAEPTTPVDDPTTSPPSRRKVNIACNNCHESRKPCNNGRPCQRCIKRGLSSSCVNHRRKRRAQALRKPTGNNVALSSSSSSSSSTASSLNVSIPRPAAQEHVSLGNSSMLSFPSPTSHHFNSPTTNETVFDSSYFYSTL